MVAWKTQFGNGLCTGRGKELTMARELGVTDGSVLPLLANALIDQGKFDRAISLEPQTKMSPDAEADLFVAQGNAFLALNKPEEAAKRFEQALFRDKMSLAAVVGKARLALAERKTPEARALLDSVFKINPNYAQAWSLLGDIENMENNAQGAQDDYTKAIKFGTNVVKKNGDLLKRAKVKVVLKDYDSAQTDLNQLVKYAPHHVGVNYVQGLLYFSQQQYQNAQKALEEALKSQPDHFLAMYYLAATKYFLGIQGQAQMLCSKILQVSPQFIPGRKLLGMIELENGNYDEVEKLIRPIVAARSEDIVALNILAAALLQQGKTDEAISLLQKVVEIQPDSAAAQMRLGAWSPYAEVNNR